MGGVSSDVDVGTGRKERRGSLREPVGNLGFIMRLFAIFSIWIIAGLCATSALSSTLEQVLTPASDSAESTAYAPPALTSMNFADQVKRRS